MLCLFNIYKFQYIIELSIRMFKVEIPKKSGICHMNNLEGNIQIGSYTFSHKNRLKGFQLTHQSVDRNANDHLKWKQKK